MNNARTGATNAGYSISQDDRNVNTGTVTTGTAMTSTGYIFLFPEIIPTLQSPTNATLS